LATEYIVRTKDLVKTFRLGDETLRALDGVSVDIKRGEYISIMGPSGSGKSTLFNAIGGLDRPDSGSVFINDVDMAQLDAGELAYLRCHTIGYIFQTFNLIPVMTALENVTLPTIFAGQPTDDGIARGMELLKIVQLDHRMHHKPSELSGGQQQRVAIARAIVNEPRIVLADEPTGNLDSKTSDQVMALFQTLWRSGLTIIFVTHEPDVAEYASRVITLKDGHIVADIRQRPKLAQEAPSPGLSAA